MSTMIAFLSGKGGSGKTTIALSIADLLCKCDVKTLLVDCDLSTNGATYFYESKMADWNKKVHSLPISFNDLLDSEDYFIEPMPFKIASKLDFIPSISEISDYYLAQKKSWRNYNSESNLNKFLNWARDSYEVILFDCQAGYTELLPILLPFVDVDLFVLETDSISASAMRSLHLKVGNTFGHSRLYQIFNKATPEEFEIYSKIVGTFFTNIGTLLFDWKIRQAFSRSIIPDLENVSAKYGQDLCNICKIIFPDESIQERLENFSSQLLYNTLEENHKQVEEKLHILNNNRNLYSKLYLPILNILFSILSIITIFFSIFSSSMHIDDNYINIVIISLLMLCFITICTILYNVDNDNIYQKRKERQRYERELKDIDRELEKLNRLQKNRTIE